MEITVVWKDKKVDANISQRIQKCFADNNLKCQETENGLHVTCDDKKNAYSYMWISMYDLVKCNWFRAVVKSCVWRDGYLSEDVMKSCVELIANGKLKTHD